MLTRHSLPRTRVCSSALLPMTVRLLALEEQTSLPLRAGIHQRGERRTGGPEGLTGSRVITKFPFPFPPAWNAPHVSTLREARGVLNSGSCGAESGLGSWEEQTRPRGGGRPNSRNLLSLGNASSKADRQCRCPARSPAGVGWGGGGRLT